MQNTKFGSYILLFTVGAVSTLLQGCSSGRVSETLYDVNSIDAVEVGNPGDPTPEKGKVRQTTMPAEQTSVTLSLVGSQLEEINRIEFNITTAEVWLIDAAGTTTITAASRKTTEQELWTIADGAVQGFSIEARPEQVLNAQKIQLALTFNTNTPGTVHVDGEQFAIQPQSSPLLINIPKDAFTSEARKANTPLSAQIELTKMKIFAPAPLPSLEPNSATNNSKKPVYVLK